MHTDADDLDRLLVFTKGAPDILLTHCSHELLGETPRVLTEARRREILATNDALARRALRTLGVACRPLAARDHAARRRR